MFFSNQLTVRHLLIIPLCGFLFLGPGCATEESQTDSDESDGVVVSTATVQTEQLQETTDAIGTLEADKKVEIRPEISAVIESIEFQEGDTVSKGDVLFRLDEGQLRQQVQARESSLAEARSRLKNARRTYERQKRLYEQDLTSGQDRDDALEAFESAKARVNRLEAELEEARDRLEDATIRASFSGVMGSHEVDEGNFVQPGQHLSTLYRTVRMKVSFTVPERVSGRVHKGQSVRAYVNSIPEEAFPGTVYFVSPSIREQTRDLLVKAYVDNSVRRLKPGMFARVELVLETLEDRPVVPAEALVATREGYVVYRIEDGKAHRQPVEIGLRQPGKVEIRDGLIPGERVVTSGHMVLSDGMSVRIQNGDDTGR